MTDENEVLARLAAADPARGQAVDTSALRRRVDARLVQIPSGSGPAARNDELSARRSRRRTWWTVAAGAAACLVIGAGSFTVGRSLGPTEGPDGAEPVAAPESEGVPDVSFEESDESFEESDESVQSAAAEEAFGSRIAQELSPDDSVVPVEYVAVGLNTTPQTAQVFAYAGASIDHQTALTRVAAALDVEGELQELEGSWEINDSDGQMLAVAIDGAATLTYLDPSIAQDEACANDPGSSNCQQSAPNPLDATRAAQLFLTEAGVDTGAFNIEVLDVVAGAVVVRAGIGFGAQVDSVLASAGVMSIATWNITVTEAGVTSATGPLAAPVSLGDYPVVSAAQAVDRLMDRRYYLGTVSGSDLPSTAPGVTPSAGDPLAWPVTEVEITNAELGLQGYQLADGTVALLPTWRLLNRASGSTWLVVGVADEALEGLATG